MIQVTCIDRIRDNKNRIKAYKIQSDDGEIKTVTPDQLKQAIINRLITVDNITLTSNNRLILNNIQDSVEICLKDIKQLDSKRSIRFAVKQNAYNITTKAQLLGCRVVKIRNNLFAIIKVDDILILTNKSKIIAKECISLFENTNFTSIDLTNLDTSEITSFALMFANTKATRINVSSLDTSNAENMSRMFTDVQLEELDLSNFNTSKVTSMSEMFENAIINKINLTSFNTRKVKWINRMFMKCKTDNLDISNFEYHSVRLMSWMFSYLHTNTLNLGTFKSTGNNAIEDIADNLFECTNVNNIIVNGHLSDELKYNRGNYKYIKKWTEL